MDERPTYRDDPEATRKLMEQLFPEPTLRRLLLARFVASVEAAHAVNPAAWEVTLRGNESRPSLRLNVGPILAFDLMQNVINVVVSEARLPGKDTASIDNVGPEVSYGRYKLVPDSGWRSVPLEIFAAEWPVLEADHLGAIRRAAGYSRRTNYYAFHCPGAMEYIARELGSPVPQPDYGDVSKVSPADEIVRLLRKRYQDWDGFDHAVFVKDEIDYKRAAARKAAELLDEADLRRLLDESRFDEIVQRLEKVAEGTNLLYRSVPRAGDLNILHQPDQDTGAIARAVVELLHGDGDTFDRIDRFAGWAREKGLPCKWPFVTYFLFLLKPASEIFIKPERTRRFLSLIGSDIELSAEVTGLTYAAIRDLVSQVLVELEVVGARDMIDAQSAMFVASEEARPIRYWKISPGDGAWEWPACAQKGFIAIGWDELGDVGSMTRKQYEARRSELEKAHTGQRGWTRRGMDQVWRFSRLEEGDKIVANNGTTEVLGIGTVEGGYYFIPGVRHGSRVPVKWDDTLPRAVQFPSWLTTLIELKAEDFSKIVSAPPVPPDKLRKIREKSIFDRRPIELKEPTVPMRSISGAISPRSFELLAMLKEDPRAEIYLTQKNEFVSLVEEPLRTILGDVATRVRPEILESMETAERLFGKILKNDWGRGGAWTYYWGAFYPKGGKRITDPQLFVVLHDDRLTAGFDIGAYADAKRERFAGNLRRNKALIAENLERSPFAGRLEFGDYDAATGAPNSSTLEQWLENAADIGARVGIRYAKYDLLKRDRDSLVAELASLFNELFPLVLLAAEEEPGTQLRAYLGEAVQDTEEAPAYSLDDLANDTFMKREELESWVRAVERKKQAIIYGPPGTGKTFVATTLAKLLVAGGDGFVETMQFHPAYAYEDFIQGIRPVADGEGAARFRLVPGRFLEFCRSAAAHKGICVLIIDEINRANLARVFGELMYLLEYRGDTVPLAAGGTLRIPTNLRILGTMNTADRSIALVDHALRRRFAFLPLWPNYDVLRRYHERENGFSVEPLIKVLQSLNQAINDLHYQVGVSFFLRPDVEAHLGEIWTQEIEPYLEEYFFNQSEAVAQYRWARVKQSLGGE